MKSVQTAVLEVIARHVQQDVPAVHHWLRLERDLDLTPLELVLIALEVDEATGVQVGPEEVALPDTVGEFVSLFVNAKNRKTRPHGASRVA
jgi:hypothetical protein